MGLLSKSWKWLAGMVGLGAVSRRVAILGVVAFISAVGGVWVHGYRTAKFACVQQNAMEQIDATEQYADNVIDASEVAIDAEVKDQNRDHFFRQRYAEIQERYNEQMDTAVIGPCSPFLTNDELRLFNAGNKAADAERVSP